MYLYVFNYFIFFKSCLTILKSPQLGVGTIFKIKIILIFFTFTIPERKHTVIVHLDVYLV
jgi:hypothetical protein